MPETKSILNIKVVTDDSTGMYSVGEIDGLFQDHDVGEYIEKYGREPLLTHLAFLQYQVIKYDIQLKNDIIYTGDKCCSA